MNGDALDDTAQFLHAFAEQLWLRAEKPHYWHGASAPDILWLSRSLSLCANVVEALAATAALSDDKDSGDAGGVCDD